MRGQNLPKPSITFRPKDVKSKNHTVIYADIYLKGRRFKLYTNHTISISEFHALQKRNKRKGWSTFEKSDLEDDLIQIKSDILNVFEFQRQKSISENIDFDFDSFKIAVKNKFSGKPIHTKSPHEYNLLKFVIFQTNLLKKQRSSETIKTYKTFIKYLENFKEHCEQQKDMKSYSLDFIDIDMNFYYDFQNYLFSHPISGKQNILINGVGKKIAQVKSFMKAAFDLGYHDNMIFMNKKFKTPREKVDDVALTEQQLKEIHEFDLSHNKSLEETKDLFVLGAAIGQRYSDLKLLDKSMLIEVDGVLFISYEKTQKSNTTAVIPYFPIVKEIWEDKYNFKLPMIDDQVFNRRVKKILEMAGFDTDRIKVRTTQGNKKIREKLPFYKLISSHTMRRTFCTIHDDKGKNLTSIKAASGHSSIKSLERYLKRSQYETAKGLLD